MIDLSHITQRYFSDFEDPDVINTGWCYVWAWMARLHHPEARLCSFAGQTRSGVELNHAVVEIDGLYYDCQQPRGVSKIQQLRFVADWRITKKSLVIEYDQAWNSFRSYWGWERRDHWAYQKLPAWPTSLDEVAQALQETG